MQKEEKPVSYIEEFNRGHRRIKREEKDWYVPYLPRGLTMEDITEKEDKELMLIFTRTEEEMEQEFEELVKERFMEYFEKKSLIGIMEYLPQKPEPISLDALNRKDMEEIKAIYKSGVEAGYTKKTIRKKIRKYLSTKGYIGKEKKPVTKMSKERKEIKVKVLSYLPQHPIPVSFDILSPEDKDVVIKLYKDGIEHGYTKKTIRKHIRRYLKDKGYLSEKLEKEKGKKKGSGTGKIDWKKTLAGYLPQHPMAVSYEELKPADRAAVRRIYKRDTEKHYTLKTIRKHLRAYLREKGYVMDEKGNRTPKIGRKKN